MQIIRLPLIRLTFTENTEHHSFSGHIAGTKVSASPEQFDHLLWSELQGPARPGMPGIPAKNSTLWSRIKYLWCGESFEFTIYDA